MAQKSLFERIFSAQVNKARGEGYDECNRVRQAQVDSMIKTIGQLRVQCGELRVKLEGVEVRTALLDIIGDAAAEHLQGDTPADELLEVVVDMSASWWAIVEREAEQRELGKQAEARALAAARSSR